MRNLIALLIAVLAVAAGGYALCAAAGWRPAPGAMALAAATALLAGGLAFVPLFLARGGSQAAVAQAALVGTAVHLFGCLAGAGIMLVALRMPAATYWLLAFYWATLVAVVVGFIRAVKVAPMTATGINGRPNGPIRNPIQK